jgi:hypothetical protein
MFQGEISIIIRFVTMNLNVIYTYFKRQIKHDMQTFEQIFEFKIFVCYPFPFLSNTLILTLSLLFFCFLPFKYNKHKKHTKIAKI